MKKLRFLIVEENETFKNNIVEILQKEFKNVELTKAKNTKEGLYLFYNSYFDLIIVGDNSQKRNGIEFCKTIKNELNYQKVPVITLLHKVTDKDIVAGFDAKADAFILYDELSGRILKSTISKIVDKSHLFNKKKILIVEDSQIILDLINNFLIKEGFETNFAKNGKEALGVLSVYKPDLIISDIGMPVMSGVELLKEIKTNEDFQNIPFIMSTFFSNSPAIKRIIEFGADAYITKPFSMNELILLIDKVLSDQFQIIVDEKRKLTAESKLMLQAIEKMNRSIEERIPYLENHSKRVAKYAVNIARILKIQEQDVELIRQASLLHDIGNIQIPDFIFNKQGKLTKDEYEVFKTHVDVGFDLLSSIPSLRFVAGIIKYHHEHYDGKGYPEGLKKDEIPLYSQVLGIAEAFDSMTSDRPYHKAVPQEKAVKIISENYGKQFSPKCVNAFLKYYNNELKRGDF